MRLVGQQETGVAAAEPRTGIFINSRALLQRLFRTDSKNGRSKADHGDSPETNGEAGPQAPDAERGELFVASDADNIYKNFLHVSDEVPDGQQSSETQKRLAAVYSANQAIAGEQKLSRVFDRILDQVFSLLPADSGVILLKGDKGEELQIEHVRLKSDSKDAQVSMTIVRRAFERGEAIITRNAPSDSRFNGGVSIMEQNISSVMCVPLTHHENRLGVLYVDNHGVSDAFRSSDLELLVALAGAAATAIKNAQYMRSVEQACQDTLLVLADAIEMRDHYTVGHTWRVTNIAVEIARELGWGEAKLEEVRMGGMLHDVGKIAVDNAILGKPEPLTDDEYARMKVHPERGANLLRNAKFLQPVVPYCLYHHERWDGTGYPFELRENEIPVEGRLIAVADTFDAMTSTRPYRKGLDSSTAIHALVEGRGTQFDPAIVDALLACHEKGRIEGVLQEYRKNETRSIICPFCRTPVHPRAEMAVGSDVVCPVCQFRIRILEKDCLYGEPVVPA
jgi:putative nucleotidyltransferase with HDIG domain